MAKRETVTLTRAEYEAMKERIEDLEDLVLANEARKGPFFPHEVATRIWEGASPLRAWREHHGLTLRELARAAGIAASYISEIERGLKPGSLASMLRIARALDTTVETLTLDDEDARQGEAA